MARPSNPYIAGAPLREERGFFGRQDVLSWVMRELRNRNSNALVLSGQRRIGKTSLLLRLQRTLAADAFLPVYFDLQDRASWPLGQVLADLADTAAEQVGIEPPNPESFDNQGRSFRRTFLPQLYSALGEVRRPVFLLDEFDVLQVAETELPDEVAAKALFPFLRRVMTEDLRPAFVLVVGRRADDLALDFTATFKASLVREIRVLDRKSAVALVRHAEVNGTLHFTDRAVEHILSLTCGHPYLTQLLCQRLWERAYAVNPTALPRIDVPDVEAAVPDALEAGDQALVWLWNGLSLAERIYAAALAQAAGEGEAITEDQAVQVLTAHAAWLRTREVELAPQELVRRRVLERVGDREYHFAVELFRRWVRQKKSLRDVKDELDRVEPLAEQLFRIGRRARFQREWDEAADFFRRALAKNPYHFRARLGLGEVLLQLGQIGEAVNELEQAYELDHDETRYTLVRALVAQAQARDEIGDENGALAACDRALEISPNEQAAREMRAAVWRRRGEAALRQDDLQTALAAYQEAEDAEKVAQVEDLQRQKKLQALYREVQDHLIEEEWSQAIADLRAILTEDPDYPGAAERLLKAKELEEIAALYSAAVGFQETSRWEQAIDGFSQIISRVGVYKDAAYRLDQAQRQQELARRYKRGENYVRHRNWEEAVREFEEVCAINPDYRDIQIGLANATRQRRLEELRKRGESSLRNEEWSEAAEIFEKLHELDPKDRSSITKLEEAKRQLVLEKSYREGMRHLQRRRWRRAAKALEQVVFLDPDYRGAEAQLKVAQERSAQSKPVIEFLRDPVWQGIGVIIAIVLAALPFVIQIARDLAKPTSTAIPMAPCNGDFEDNFECWQHGGELDQSIGCDGDQCYAVLGNPDYACDGGVPVGEAWMKQVIGVPQTTSPTLSLRYQVSSYDLFFYDASDGVYKMDYFQLAIDGEPLEQRGNNEWNKSDCNRDPWNSGWQTLTLDLSPYRGQEIELSFHNVNGFQPYYNTWTYVDNVKIGEAR